MSEEKEVTPTDYYMAWKAGKLEEFIEQQRKEAEKKEK